MEFTVFSDVHFMNEALKEATLAAGEGEVPVGAVVVWDNRIIARARNMTERLNDVTAHAEMLAITAAANYTGGKYLPECTLFVTLEPCPMCAAALAWAQIGKIVYGASDPKNGYTLINHRLLHPRTRVSAGLKHEECAGLLRKFFKEKRNA